MHPRFGQRSDAGKEDAESRADVDLQHSGDESLYLELDRLRRFGGRGRQDRGHPR